MLQLFLQAPGGGNSDWSDWWSGDGGTSLEKSSEHLQKQEWSTKKNQPIKIFFWRVLSRIGFLSGQNLAQITLARSLKQHGGWISSDIVGTAALRNFSLSQGTTLCLLTKTSYQDLHARTSKRISQARQRRTFAEDLARSSYKNFRRVSQKSCHTVTSTSNTMHLQDLHARTSYNISLRSPQVLLSRTPARSWSRSHAKTSKRISQDVTEGLARENLGICFIKHLLRTSQTPFQTNTSNTWNLQDLHARTSYRGF